VGDWSETPELLRAVFQRKDSADKATLDVALTTDADGATRGLAEWRHN
jgi:hypothetical protein